MTTNNHHHTTHTHTHNHHNPLMIDQEIERLNTKLCSEQSSASPSASTLFLIHHDLMILHYLKRKNSHHHNNHNNHNNSTTNTSKKKKKKKKQQQQQTVLQNNVISENKKHETEDDRQYDESSSSSSSLLLLEEETLYNHLTSLKSKYSSHSNNNNNGNSNNSNNGNSGQVKRDDLDHHPILMYNQALLHFIFQRYANVIDGLFPIFEQFQSKLIPSHETTNNINNSNNNNSNSSKSNKSDHVNSNNNSSSSNNNNNVGDFNSTSCVLLEKYEEFYVLKICFLLLDCLLSQCVMESESRRMTHEIIEYLNIVFRSTLVMDYYTKPSTTVNTGGSGGGSRLGKATNAAPFQYFSVAESKFWLHIYRMRYYLFVSDVESACVEFKIIAQLFVHRVSNAGNTDVIHAQHLSPCKKDVITSLMQAKILIEKYKQSPLNKQSDIISKCVQLMNHMRPQVLPMVYYNNMAYMHMREHLDQVNLSHSKTTNPSNEYSNTPASFYFAKLMEANVDFHDRDMSKSASTEPDARILYNIGVQEMQAKNFSRAFDTLYRCAYTMYNNPYVWIRLTECCIAENERLTALNKQQKNVASVYVESKLDGIFVQKVILPATQNVTGLPLMSSDRHQQKHSNSPTGIGPQCSVSSSSEFVRSSSLPFTLPSMSLETANQCIQNAISLLSRQSAPSSIMLLNALQKSAYIHLLVKNYAAAFNTCQQILSDPHCSRETRAKIQVYLSVANQYL